MEHKDLKLEVRSFDADERTLSGYASTFGFPTDSYGDIVARGAFVDSVQKIKTQGLPLLMDHDTSVKSVLGTVIDAYEDDIGLFIKARLADTESVNEIRQKLIQGHLSKMSIGFFIEKQSFIEDAGKEVRVIEKANLMEISVVTIPANDRATILSVKAQETKEADAMIAAEKKELQEPSIEFLEEAYAEYAQFEQQLQEDGVRANEVTENASPCKTPEHIALESIADLLQQSLNNTRRKYYGK